MPIEEVLEGYGVPPTRTDDAPEPHTPGPLEQPSTPTPLGTSLTPGCHSHSPSRKVVVTSTSTPSSLYEHDAQTGDIDFEEPGTHELAKADNEMDMDVDVEAAESDDSDGSEIDGFVKDVDIPIQALLMQ